MGICTQINRDETYFFNFEHVLWLHFIKKTLVILPNPLDKGFFTIMQNHIFVAFTNSEKKACDLPDMLLREIVP